MESGTKLGHYEISTLLGKGGMGEVWRARDTKLGREVAIKTLPEEFAKDADRLARFEREAKLLASLNHPNIAAIHGFEEDNGTHFLVLELVEGDTLADQIKRGAIPIEESLKLALQIAEALEAAHEKGVIHRDLKPANIKVNDDGNVKVLDFGLAKAFEGDGADAGLSNSPTLSMAATQQGVILGTAAYMSPEQAKGREVDMRADVWAFGCVLYEMLTGSQAFGGEEVSEILASVLAREADYTTLQPDLHPRLREVLERCLEKILRKRFQGIGDVIVDIEKVQADPSGVLVQPVADVVQATPQAKLPWAIAVLGILIAGVASWTFRPLPTSDSRPVRRFSFALPDEQQFGSTSRRVVAVSPDGLRIVYSGSPSGLYLRSMDEPDARLISGSADAAAGTWVPFFSPDGQSIAYYQGGQLRKIAITGGASVALSDVVSIPRGASWDVDDTIVYGQLDGIWQVSANGGMPERIVENQEGELVSLPQVLPGGEWLLFTVNLAQIVVQSLESGERKVVLKGGADARYVPTGHLVYVVEDVLFAAPFDLELLERTGAGVPVIEEIGIAQNSGAGQFSVANDGTLVYTTSLFAAQASNLAWVDRNGATTPITEEPLVYERPRISPDEQRVAVDISRAGADGDIWIIELQGGRRTRLTVDPADDLAPLWTRDGLRVTFASNRDGMANALYWTPADGSGTPELLAAGQQNLGATSWSPNGETLLFYEVGTEYDMWTINPGEEPRRFLSTPFNERGAVFSPNGQWVAYASNETERYEVYVTPYPGPGGKITISADGGRSPLWSGDGAELFYRNEDQMMIVTVSTDNGFRAGIPEILFEGSLVLEASVSGTTNYDVTADGQRFLMLEPSFGGTDSDADTRRINIVLNWFEELKERVPVP